MLKHAAVALLVALVSAWDETVMMQTSRKTGWFHEVVAKGQAATIGNVDAAPIQRTTAAYAHLALYKEHPETSAESAGAGVKTSLAKKPQEVTKTSIALLQGKPEAKKKEFRAGKPVEAQAAKPKVALLQEKQEIKRDDVSLTKPVEAKKSVASTPAKMQAKPQMKGTDGALVIQPTEAQAPKSKVALLQGKPEIKRDDVSLTKPVEAKKSVASAPAKMQAKPQMKGTGGALVVQPTKVEAAKPKASLLQDTAGLKKDDVKLPMPAQAQVAKPVASTQKMLTTKQRHEGALVSATPKAAAQKVDEAARRKLRWALGVR